jgi:hypothetical protein
VYFDAMSVWFKKTDQAKDNDELQAKQKLSKLSSIVEWKTYRYCKELAISDDQHRCIRQKRLQETVNQICHSSNENQGNMMI